MYTLKIMKPEIKKVCLDSGECYEIEQLDNDQIKVCDENIKINDKIKTITVDYEFQRMTGFQFRKLTKYLQCRWFRINTHSRVLIHGDWENLFF